MYPVVHRPSEPPVSHAVRSALPRALTIVCLSLLAYALAAAAPAQASHLKGASLEAQIDSAGQLTGTVTLIAANYGSCASPYPEIGAVYYTPPGGSQTSISIPSGSQTITACTPGSVTTQGTFSVSVAGQADGVFEIRQIASARVSGIQNGAPSSIDVRAKVKKQAGFTHRTPRLTSQPALGVSKLAAYSQQLATSTESGAAPTVALMQSADTGNTATYDSTAPSTNLVSVTSGGLVEIPFSTTSGLTVGHYYVYKVRITDDQGQYIERDLLLTVSNNAPPVFSGESPSGTIDIKPGVPTTLNFTASDPDSGQTLTMAVGGVPSWGSSSTGTGTATVSLNAPESAVGTSTQISVDATDSDTTAPMTSARTVTVRVVANTPAPTPEPTPTPTPTPTPVSKPAAPTLVSAPPATTTSRDAEITWTGEAGGNYTCVVNTKPAAACSSPLKLSGLAPGRHTVRVFQSNSAGDGQILEVSWIVTEARIDVGAKLAVKSGENLSVGCKVAGVTIERCTVDVFTDVPAAGRARAAKKVKIGTGTFVANTTTNAVDIKLTLNETGKRLVNRLGGVKVILDMTATPKGGGQKLTATGTSVLLPSRVKVTPATGIFTHQSAQLTSAARAWVKTTASQLGTAQSVRCTGHTARSGKGLPEANRRLGLRRAKAICAALKQAGAKVKTTAVTAGETQPRSSNRTAAGRAKNRRVELTVTYPR